jgi:hypothetical protein
VSGRTAETNRAAHAGPARGGHMNQRVIWTQPGSSALAVVSREEASAALGLLTGEQLDELDLDYPGDAWAFGRAIAWKYAEAVRRGWLLGPA